MTSPSRTAKSYFQTMKMIHLMLMVSMVFFALIALYINLGSDQDFKDPELHNVMIFIVPFIVLGGIFGSRVFYRNRLNTIKSSENLKTKMAGWQTALIIRYALLEFPAFISIVGYFITGEIFYLLIAVLIIVMFALARPNTNSAIIDLELSNEERNKILDPNAEIADVNH